MKQIVLLTNSHDATADHLIHTSALRRRILRIDTDKERCVTYGSAANKKRKTVKWIINRRPFEAPEPSLAKVEDRISLSEQMESFYNEFSEFGWNKWINSPQVNWRAQKKLSNLWLANACGLKTPRWIVTNEKVKAEAFVASCKNGCVVKPINHGHFADGDEIALIYANRVNLEIPLDSISVTPTFFQEEVHKRADARVTFILGCSLAVEMVRDDNEIDIRKQEFHSVRYSVLPIPKHTEHHIYKLMKSLSLNFAQIDFVVDGKGEWWFLEVNPNGQWAWMDAEIGGQITKTIDAALIGAGVTP